MDRQESFLQRKSQPESKVNVMLKTWRPQPTVFSTVLHSCIVGVVLIGASIGLFIATSTIQEIQLSNYQSLQQCSNVLHTSTPCNVTISINTFMKKPVYLLYEVSNFYQNYKRFFTSKSSYQLEGNPISSDDAQKACQPVVLNKDLNVNMSWGGLPLNLTDVASPCGLIAKSFFNDTYELFYSNGSRINITETGISWPLDKGRKFKQQPNSLAIQWIDPQNEHFIVWMRTSGFPNFQKPWGIIQSDLPIGNYTLQITNNYAIQQFNAHKSVLLTTVNALGGKNYFLPISMLIFGLVFVAAAFLFYFRYKTTGGMFGPKTKRM